MTVDVIYLAAGQGIRAGLGYPKQFARLGGKPIMIHGLEVLQKMEEVGRIIVTYPSVNSMGLGGGNFNPFFTDRVVVIEGGATRQESVFNALKHVATDYVLIAEAVRPFITAPFVRKVIETPGDFVTPIMPAVSSVVEWGKSFINGCFWARGIPREQVGEVQMPQKFRTELLRKAHVMTPTNDSTDDAALLLQVTTSQPVIIPGLEQNIKITTPLDLIIAEAIYNARYSSQE